MSDESEDDFVEFGTALGPFKEGEFVRKKPLTIEEQFARDKYGKRRFHGAFTGGFSAGFLNTVGSLQGFQPSSYKSSRSEKAQSIVQTPEQFMDAEDTEEFGIAPSVLRAKDDYQSSLDTPTKYFDCESEIMIMSELENLLRPVRETVGIKLLRKMGWKPGQGVGPRVTKQEKKRISQVRTKVYGCSLPNEKREEDESDSDVDDEALEYITFAPNDFPFQLVTPKENFFGLGYVGLDRRSILSAAPNAKPNIRGRNRKGITGLAFGVGALEEEDEDIYLKEDMSQYDFALGGNDQDENSASDIVTGDLYEIFVLGLKIKDTIFQPPILPGKPKPGEKPLEPVPSTSKTKPHGPFPERKISHQQREDLHRQARAMTESLSLHTEVDFQPFIFDSDKEERYEKYINLLAKGRPDDLANIQPINMTEWEREKERIEFEQANKLFKPLSSDMQDRFTAAMQYDHFNDTIVPVDKMKFGTDEEVKAAKMNLYGRMTRTVENWIPCGLLCKRFNIREKSVDELLLPTSKGKYYALDDFMISLHPAKSQTQQENIEVQSPETDKLEDTNQSKSVDFDNLPENKIDLFNAIFLDTDSDDDVDNDNEINNKTDQSEPVKKEEETEMEKTEMEKTEMEKTEMEKTETEKTETRKNNNMEMLYEENMINETRNTSPARGIFENLDYDLLISYKPKNTQPKFENKDEIPGPSGVGVTSCSEEKQEQMNVDMAYGPKLPEVFAQKKIDFVPYMADLQDWVEKKISTTHKKNKKRKKSKHKSKYKANHGSLRYSHRH